MSEAMVRSVRVRLLPGLLAAASLLIALQLAVGLTPAGWAVAVSFALATLILLAQALVREGAPGPRPADQVTLARVALTGGVAALVAGSFVRPVDTAVLVTMALLALVLDTVDGEVAR